MASGRQATTSGKQWLHYCRLHCQCFRMEIRFHWSRKYRNNRGINRLEILSWFSGKWRAACRQSSTNAKWNRWCCRFQQGTTASSNDARNLDTCHFECIDVRQPLCRKQLGSLLSGNPERIFYTGRQFYHFYRFGLWNYRYNVFRCHLRQVFQWARNAPALIFGLMNVMALCLFLLVPGVHFWVDALSMVLFGTAIGVSSVSWADWWQLTLLPGSFRCSIRNRRYCQLHRGRYTGYYERYSHRGHKSIVDGKEILTFLISIFFGSEPHYSPSFLLYWYGMWNQRINRTVSIIKNVSSFRPHMNLFRIFAWTSPFLMFRKIICC